jgi:hypothetical protein
MTPNIYDSVNKIWPKEIPPCTRIEAQRGAQRLVTAFIGASYGAPRVRRCWIALSPPYGTLSRGWRRLVHDVSHRAWSAQHRGQRPHSGFHAALEREMAEYVVSHGWLDGKLKPTPTAKPTRQERRASRLAGAEAKLAAWERRVKLATGKVRRWRRRVQALRRETTAPRQPV